MSRLPVKILFSFSIYVSLLRSYWENVLKIDLARLDHFYSTCWAWIILEAQYKHSDLSPENVALRFAWFDEREKKEPS